MNDKTPTVRYDAGILNDFGGGNVEWWLDYIRAELDRSHDYYIDTIEAQATRIEALEAALRKIEGQAVCVAMPATEDEMRDWLQNILQTTQQALESQP